MIIFVGLALAIIGLMLIGTSKKEDPNEAIAGLILLVIGAIIIDTNM